MTWLRFFWRWFHPGVLGWDDALYAAVAAYGAYSASSSARSTNAGNVQINSHNAAQADTFFNDSQQFNMEEAGKARQFDQEMWMLQAGESGRQAQYNRDFQERMSGTQYQRAVNDAQAAGLNPMLTVSQGGAGTPSGGAASGGGTMTGPAASSPGGQVPSKIAMQQQSNPTAAALLSSAQAVSQVKNLDATTKNIESQTALNEARVPESVMRTKEMEQGIQNSQKEYEVISARVGNVLMDTDLKAAQVKATKANERLTEVQKQYQMGQVGMQPVVKAKLQLDQTLLEYEKAAGAGKYKLDTSEYGQSGGREILKEGADLLGTVARGRLGMRRSQ